MDNNRLVQNYLKASKNSVSTTTWRGGDKKLGVRIWVNQSKNSDQGHEHGYNVETNRKWVVEATNQDNGDKSFPFHVCTIS